MQSRGFAMLKFVIAAGATLAFVYQQAQVGKMPIGKTPIGKTPIGKTPIGKTPVATAPLITKG
jgi:hypothetical protein